MAYFTAVIPNSIGMAHIPKIMEKIPASSSIHHGREDLKENTRLGKIFYLMTQFISYQNTNDMSDLFRLVFLSFFFDTSMLYPCKMSGKSFM